MWSNMQTLEKLESDLQAFSVKIDAEPDNEEHYLSAAALSLEIDNLKSSYEVKTTPDKKRALDFLLAAVQSSPKNLSVYGPLLDLLGRVRDNSLSEKVIKRFTETFSKEPMSYALSARCCLKLKDLERAHQLLLQGIELDSQHVECRLVLSEYYLTCSELNSAKEQVSKLLEQFPSDERVSELASKIEFRLGNYAESFKLLKPFKNAHWASELKEEIEKRVKLQLAKARVGDREILQFPFSRKLESSSEIEPYFLEGAQLDKIFELSSSSIRIVWDLSFLEDVKLRKKFSSGKRKLELKRALGIVSVLKVKDADLLSWLEDHFSISTRANLESETIDKIVKNRVLIGTGAGLGNILQTAPLIKKLAEYLGHPVDVCLGYNIDEAILLFARSKWVNLVHSGFENVSLKEYDKVFLTYNSGPFIPDIKAKELFVQIDNYEMFDSCQQMHETEFNFLGIENLFPEFSYNLEVDTKDNYFLGDKIYSFPENKIVGICSGFRDGRWEKRSWDQFEALVTELQKQGFEVRSFGSKSEYVKGARDYTSTTLRESIDNLLECSYFIGTDGGLFHIAEALGIPSIVIFGPTSIVKNGPKSGKTRLVHSGLECSPCQFKLGFWRCGDVACMKGLGLNEVLVAFDELREGGQNDQSVEKANAHEIGNLNNPYRESFRERYLEESFASYPSSKKVIKGLIDAQLGYSNLERANEILAFAKKKFPDAPHFNRSLSSYSLNHSAVSSSSASRVGLVDVYLTTYRRPRMLERTLDVLLKACDSSPFEHRVMVLADNADLETFDVLRQYLEKINLVSTSSQLGLPFMFNLILDYSRLLASRTEKAPEYICYIQDDVLIKDPKNYFSLMVDVHQSYLRPCDAGYVSGFYTPIHPGFEKGKHGDVTVVESDSLDGKNIMGTPELFHSVQSLSWYFPDGERRGNPGPKRGSHFDLWQWLESPNCTKNQGRVNLIIPGLCETIATSSAESTWENPGDSRENIEKRIKEGRIYNTREAYPILEEGDYYRGKG